MVNAAREADRLLAVDLSYRFTEGMQRIREVVQSGGLGRIYAVDLVFHNAYGPDKPWFYDPALSGGGCVMDLGVHLVDLALWTLEFPSVSHVSSKLFRDGEPLGLRARPSRGLRCGDAGAVHGRRCAARVLLAPSSGMYAVISASFFRNRGRRGAAQCEWVLL